MTCRKDQQLETQLQPKLRTCQAILKSLETVVVAFSAGVDSTFLLALAVETLGRDNVLAAMGVSPSLAGRERLAGRRLAEQIGTDLVEIETGELEDSSYSANPPDRCFYCKRDLFVRLRQLADERGLSAVISGANADDADDFRPGMRAAKQLCVRSPLLEADLTKDEIRLASRAMDLETWNKPAMACLASRVAYGNEITAEKLSRIEQAEYALKDMGFGQCRVRDHGAVARIEVPVDRLEQALVLRSQIVESLRRLGYAYITLDLQGFRSGSMNEQIGRQMARNDDASF